MNRIAPFLAAATAALLAAAAPASTPSPEAIAKAQTKLDHILANRAAGKPVNCVLESQINEVQTFDGIGILYRVGAVYYLNRPQSGAGSIGYDPILVTDTHSSSLCRNDTVKLIDRGSRFYRDFLILGDFTPYPLQR